jgi:hypothetical protein
MNACISQLLPTGIYRDDKSRLLCEQLDKLRGGTLGRAGDQQGAPRAGRGADELRKE